MYEDGRPGEIFITMNKEGSTISGIMDAFATSTSLNLQYGVPLQVLVDKFTYMRFEPSGFTSNKQIPMVKSIMDYIFRWMAIKFLTAEEAAQVHAMIEKSGEMQALPTVVVPAPPQATLPIPVVQETVPPTTATSVKNDVQGNGLGFTFQNQRDAELCSECGSMMVRNGACYKCLECGSTSGCS